MMYVDATTMFQDGTGIKIGVKWFDPMSPSFSVAINLVLQHLQLFEGQITTDNNHWNSPAFAIDILLWFLTQLTKCGILNFRMQFEWNRPSGIGD
jgi:hypothetical protein